MVSLLWSFGSKNWGSEAGCLCVTGDTNILHQLAVTLEWLVSNTCWQMHSQDDARENDESRNWALTCVTEKATKVVARLQCVNDTKHPTLCLLWISSCFVCCCHQESELCYTCKGFVSCLYTMILSCITCMYQKYAANSFKIPHNFLGLS